MYIKKFTVIFSLAIACHAMFSCNEQSGNSTSTVTITDTVADTEAPGPPQVSTMQPTMNCYSGNLGKDSFNLRVEQFPNAVTGFLTYNFYEKDKSEGDLDGKIMGDTLLATYTYSSEGKTSSRQVIFLIKENIATEGYADMQEQDGKMVFKDLRTVKFSGPKLMNVPCHSN